MPLESVFVQAYYSWVLLIKQCNLEEVRVGVTEIKFLSNMENIIQTKKNKHKIIEEKGGEGILGPTPLFKSQGSDARNFLLTLSFHHSMFVVI